MKTFEIRKKAVSLIGWWKDRFYGDSNLKAPTEIHIAPPSDTLTTKYTNDRVSKVKAVEYYSGDKIRVNFKVVIIEDEFRSDYEQNLWSGNINDPCFSYLAKLTPAQWRQGELVVIF